ncbi:YcgN family cysteine cluster protein [Halomonas sp. PR-M31]|uniref:YcgN family cysteine cluster protein n=1 Tax=Halomonas sp. PR-M31 TaxID=1471202 RepID=UPI0006519572|nr:YcgN family cysteine cluster protein [Halomonas sp. PR-M31]
MRERFWERFSLEELDHEEWEALCDGCGRCCLIKLEDEDSGDVLTLDVACKLLDTQQCRCQDYPHRFARVPACTQMSLQTLRDFHWLPDTCAYRRLHEGRGLADWHPLISKTSKSVHRARVSVAHFAVSERDVSEDKWEDHVIAVLPCED